jgi:hypothetical protein
MTGMAVLVVYGKEIKLYSNIILYYSVKGDRGGTVVKVPCYKSKGSWFGSKWCHWNFSLT